MMNALAEYLTGMGYGNVCVDFMPDEKDVPEVVYLGLWEHRLGEYHDGTSSRYVQIQVRRKTADEARDVCSEILLLLDSGSEEEIIDLTPEIWCIGRPNQGAKIIARGEKTTTYYGNVVLWGKT